MKNNTPNGIIATGNWSPRRSARKHARQLIHHGRKLLHVQRDLLTAEQMEIAGRALNRLSDVVDEKKWNEFDSAVAEAEKHLQAIKPQRKYSMLRENWEAIFVAIVIAGAVRAFFIQPFKIPTGSMQPTLFGIHQTAILRVIDGADAGNSYKIDTAVIGREGNDNDIALKDETVTNYQARIVATGGSHYYRLSISRLTQDGTLEVNGTPVQWGEYRDIMKGDQIKVGKTTLLVTDIKQTGGDRIFVDRFTYNFIRPTRGDVIVFRTRNIKWVGNPPSGDFYIKRLVGLPNDKIQIRDRKLIIGDNEVTSPPIFQKIQYNARYDGYANAGKLMNHQDSHRVAEDHYFALGDNTENSQDSRYWGDFPKHDVIGKAFFVYWPISSRIGLIK